MENPVLKGKVNEAQLLLLKFFATEPSEKHMEELQQLVTRQRWERLMDAADEIWEEKGWTQKDMEKMSKTHMRTPYDRSGAINFPTKA
jgi:NADH:ubiquinone oxidoreductase subunit E